MKVQSRSINPRNQKYKKGSRRRWEYHYFNCIMLKKKTAWHRYICLLSSLSERSGNVTQSSVFNNYCSCFNLPPAEVISFFLFAFSLQYVLWCNKEMTRKLLSCQSFVKLSLFSAFRTSYTLHPVLSPLLQLNTSHFKIKAGYCESWLAIATTGTCTCTDMHAQARKKKKKIQILCLTSIKHIVCLQTCASVSFSFSLSHMQHCSSGWIMSGC